MFLAIINRKILESKYDLLKLEKQEIEAMMDAEQRKRGKQYAFLKWN